MNINEAFLSVRTSLMESLIANYVMLELSYRFKTWHEDSCNSYHLESIVTLQSYKSVCTLLRVLEHFLMLTKMTYFFISNALNSLCNGLILRASLLLRMSYC